MFFSRPPFYGISTVVAAAAATAPAVVLATAMTMVLSAEAEATTYHVRTQTAARATQHLRSDTTFATRRVLSQSLTLSAYDLRDNQTGDLNARLGIRYSTDLGVAPRLRQDPLFDARWNDISLDIAYLEYQPIDAVQITAGRQWHQSPLGIADFDGVAVDWRLPGDGWQPFAGVAAGRDVQRGLTPFDPGAFDVQGLPPNETVVTDDPWHWMGAANAGIRHGREHRVEVVGRHQRRPRADDATETATTNHVAATATTAPFEPFTITALGSYHSLVHQVDRARVDAAHRFDPGVVSAGVDHRRPVFDSASIFNIFGAQPHRSGYLTYRHPVEALAAVAEARVWTRLYFDEDARIFDPGDDRAVGAALSSRHQMRVIVPVDLSWQFSAQTITGETGGDQYLGTTRLRAPGPMTDLFLTGRLTGLWATPGHPRRDDGWAATAGVGAELGIGDIGEVSVNLEHRGGSFTRANTAVFALLELEAWQ